MLRIIDLICKSMSNNLIYVDLLKAIHCNISLRLGFPARRSATFTGCFPPQAFEKPTNPDVGVLQETSLVTERVAKNKGGADRGRLSRVIKAGQVLRASAARGNTCSFGEGRLVDLQSYSSRIGPSGGGSATMGRSNAASVANGLQQ